MFFYDKDLKRTSRVGSGYSSIYKKNDFKIAQQDFERKLGNFAFNDSRSKDAANSGLERLKAVLSEYYINESSNELETDINDIDHAKGSNDLNKKMNIFLRFSGIYGNENHNLKNIINSSINNEPSLSDNLGLDKDAINETNNQMSKNIFKAGIKGAFYNLFHKSNIYDYKRMKLYSKDRSSNGKIDEGFNLIDGGNSKVTGMMLNSYRWLGLGDTNNLLNFRLAIIGWLLESGDGSLYEILKNSHMVGVKGEEDMTDAETMDLNVSPLTKQEILNNCGLEVNYHQFTDDPQNVIIKPNSKLLPKLFNTYLNPEERDKFFNNSKNYKYLPYKTNDNKFDSNKMFNIKNETSNKINNLNTTLSNQKVALTNLETEKTKIADSTDYSQKATANDIQKLAFQYESFIDKYRDPEKGLTETLREIENRLQSKVNTFKTENSSYSKVENSLNRFKELKKIYKKLDPITIETIILNYKIILGIDECTTNDEETNTIDQYRDNLQEEVNKVQNLKTKKSNLIAKITTLETQITNLLKDTVHYTANYSKIEEYKKEKGFSETELAQTNIDLKVAEKGHDESVANLSSFNSMVEKYNQYRSTPNTRLAKADDIKNIYSNYEVLINKYRDPAKIGTPLGLKELNEIETRLHDAFVDENEPQQYYEKEKKYNRFVKCKNAYLSLNEKFNPPIITKVQILAGYEALLKISDCITDDEKTQCINSQIDYLNNIVNNPNNDNEKNNAIDKLNIITKIKEKYDKYRQKNPEANLVLINYKQNNENINNTKKDITQTTNSIAQFKNELSTINNLSNNFINDFLIAIYKSQTSKNSKNNKILALDTNFFKNTNKTLKSTDTVVLDTSDDTQQSSLRFDVNFKNNMYDNSIQDVTNAQVNTTKTEKLSPLEFIFNKRHRTDSGKVFEPYFRKNKEIDGALLDKLLCLNKKSNNDSYSNILPHNYYHKIGILKDLDIFQEKLPNDKDRSVSNLNSANALALFCYKSQSHQFLNSTLILSPFKSVIKTFFFYYKMKPIMEKEIFNYTLNKTLRYIYDQLNCYDNSPIQTITRNISIIVNKNYPKRDTTPYNDMWQIMRSNWFQNKLISKDLPKTTMRWYSGTDLENAKINAHKDRRPIDDSTKIINLLEYSDNLSDEAYLDYITAENPSINRFIDIIKGESEILTNEIMDELELSFKHLKFGNRMNKLVDDASSVNNMLVDTLRSCDHYNGKVYSGQQWGLKYKVGNIVKYSEFTSTSEKTSVAASYYKGALLILKLRNSGVLLGDELEQILLPPGAKFKVTKVVTVKIGKDENGKYVYKEPTGLENDDEDRLPLNGSDDEKYLPEKFAKRRKLRYVYLEEVSNDPVSNNLEDNLNEESSSQDTP